MFLLSILLVLLLPISGVLSTTDALDSGKVPTVLGPVGQLHIANNVIAPDGYKRSTVLANGAFPAPLIRANKARNVDDQFVVQVYNELTDATMPLQTSIHWHGIFQKTSNWADGVSSVTQCPLRQNEMFEYRFNPTGQAGTYWYHSHYLTQYSDGLRGPLVIYDPDDPLAHLYDVDDENTVITLADWYHLHSPEIAGIVTAAIQNSTLINGHGRYGGGPLVLLSVINVRQGSRYRFRVISISCDRFFNFTIDSHRMTIIEVDGNEVSPVEVDSIPILAGQRYSVVVTADKPIGSYWIRSLPDLANATFEGGQHMAILRYQGAPEQDPTSKAGPYELSFDEGKLHPLIDPGAPGLPEIGKADVNLQLLPELTPAQHYTLNNVSFVEPSVPILLQILSGVKHPSQLLPNGSVYELPRNKVVEISFPNTALPHGVPHPIHLHGHAFDVVRIAGSNVTNFVNPVRRDVVSLGTSPTDNVTIRFITDNPGPWFLHCHIEWHLNLGFAVVMAEAPSEAAKEEGAVTPVEWYRLCRSNDA